MQASKVIFIYFMQAGKNKLYYERFRLLSRVNAIIHNPIKPNLIILNYIYAIYFSHQLTHPELFFINFFQLFWNFLCHFGYKGYKRNKQGINKMKFTKNEEISIHTLYKTIREDEDHKKAITIIMDVITSGTWAMWDVDRVVKLKSQLSKLINKELNNEYNNI